MLIVQRHEGRTLRAIGSCVIDRDTEGDAPEPNAEPRRVGNQVEISERAKEGFLGDVIGIRGANEREGERIYHPLVSTDELPERVVGRRCACSRSGHELGIGPAIGDGFQKRQGDRYVVGYHLMSNFRRFPLQGDPCSLFCSQKPA